MKKIAVMQPYLFPYIGYFHLINAVDRFILFDDVNFIMRGWINRNNILVNGQKSLFSVPIDKASQNKLINETEITDQAGWKVKFLKTLKTAYAKAPFLKEIYPLIEGIVHQEEANLSAFIHRSLLDICRELGITTQIVPSSSIYENKNLKGQERIIDICLQEGADVYINAIGGRELYDPRAFREKGLSIKFIKSGTIVYPQFKTAFVPGLSIIDILMFNPRDRTGDLLKNFQLV